MSDLSKELFAIGLSGLDLTRHSQVVPLEGVMPKPDHLTEEDVDAMGESYERTLQKAQARFGYRPFIPSNEGPF